MPDLVQLVTQTMQGADATGHALDALCGRMFLWFGADVVEVPALPLLSHTVTRAALRDVVTARKPDALLVILPSPNPGAPPFVWAETADDEALRCPLGLPCKVQPKPRSAFRSEQLTHWLGPLDPPMSAALEQLRADMRFAILRIFEEVTSAATGHTKPPYIRPSQSRVGARLCGRI